MRRHGARYARRAGRNARWASAGGRVRFIYPNMKRSLLFTLCAFLISLVPPRLVAAEAKPALDSSGHPFDLKTLAIGDAAPDFALPGIDGRVWRLADFGGTDVLMVLFTSNHCPTSHGQRQPVRYHKTS